MTPFISCTRVYNELTFMKGKIKHSEMICNDL